MEELYYESTDVSPEVKFNLIDNHFLIKGKSVVSEVDSFYEPILNWIENAAFNPEKTLQFVFDLEYFNVFSSKRILFILYKLSDLREKGLNVNVIWNFSFEDDDMKEVGEDFACMVNIPFEFISKSLQPELI